MFQTVAAKAKSAIRLSSPIKSRAEVLVDLQVSDLRPAGQTVAVSDVRIVGGARCGLSSQCGMVIARAGQQYFVLKYICT